MESIWDPTYIVTDVETTGSDPVNNRITEIACVAVRGTDIISEYVSLINPHQEIPSFIAKMTGISQSMVQSAPNESEIVETVRSLFKVKTPIFTAHNVNFDYSFMNAFFKRNYVNFDFPQLCTLKLARKLIPRDQKKNVGDLSDYFGIRMKNRHRALADAKSTAMILIELLSIAEKEHSVKTLNELLAFQHKPVYNYKVSSAVSQRVRMQVFDAPYCPGLFKFYDADENLLYWDYSFNLNQKLISFFDSHYITSKNVLEMTLKIERVEWEEAESELSVLIMRDKMQQRDIIEADFGQEKLDLFSPVTDLFSNQNINADFIYVQAQNSNEHTVNIYLIKNGKLSFQAIVGKKASLEQVKHKVKEIYFSESNDFVVDYSELKVINRWIEMQSDMGLEISINNLDFKAIIDEMQKAIIKSFEILKPVNSYFI